MLVLKDIKKDYGTGEDVTHALNGLSLEFSEKGLTSILGPSGCGKTTLLNIIGGLDKYTSGDILIDNKSTKSFKDIDWDAYRNAHIGFVFQSYNLISHLTVLENVAISLSLAGVKSKERKRRAKEALEKVGLKDKCNKKPNQLSGGQMQRVAIARALINNPDIILADEPTGALDSETSKQVLEILKEVSKDHLVIMVTHNKELANQYSDRIIEMKDGRIINDNNLINIDDSGLLSEDMKNKHTKMSFGMAISSSFKNLVSKKGRTIITSIAGSIGIIGVALVLAMSNGMNNFITNMERDTLAGFPLTINEQVTTRFNLNGDKHEDFPDEDIYYPYNPSDNVIVHNNVITNEYLEYLNKLNNEYYSVIEYNYGLTFNIVSLTDSGNYKLVNTVTSSNILMSTSIFSELPDNREFIETQYDVLTGNYPTSYDEIALVVNSDNTLNTSLLDELGISIDESYTSADLLNRNFKVILNNDYYEKQSDTFYSARSNLESLYKNENAIDIRISCILRVKETASSELLSSGLVYTSNLTKLVLEDSLKSDIVLSQKENKTINVLTGNEFNSRVTYDSVMKTIGGIELPSSISIYPSTFENKDLIKEYLDIYNENKIDDEKILYSDLSESVTSTIDTIISTISIVLVALAGISLVVSTVMIGIITYVSVVERTKEIGIMRAIGGRKKDISRIFNAEAGLIGLCAGLIGVIFTYLLSIPISLLISNIIGFSFTLLLDPLWAIGLVLISVALTLIAAFIPARIASKKDPVNALRAE